MEDDFCVDENIAHDKKWGKLWTTSKKVKETFGGDALYQMNFHRKNIKTDKDRKQERKEKNAIYKLEEERKEKMRKMVEDMVLGKKSKDTEINKKDSVMSKLLTKNLESIKKIAEKEGISLSELIKILKKSE
jgi:hypothetical protein